MSIEEMAWEKDGRSFSETSSLLTGPLWYAVTSTSMLGSISETSRFLPREFPEETLAVELLVFD